MAFLRAAGAADLDHPGGDLLSHLCRTRDLLAAWGIAETVCRAGLCHAAYGTTAFPPVLVPVTARDRLVAVIGAEAEALVYRYGACDRAAVYPGLDHRPWTMVDRFTGAATALEPAEASAFAVMTIANELDITRHATLRPDERAGIVTLIRRLAPDAPGPAALALAELDMMGP